MRNPADRANMGIPRERKWRMLGRSSLTQQQQNMAQSVDLKESSRRAWFRPASLLHGFKASLREHALLIGIVAVHFLAAATMPWWLERPLNFQLNLVPVAATIWLIGFWTV